MTGQQLLSGLDDDGAPAENVSVKSSPKLPLHLSTARGGGPAADAALRAAEASLSAKVADMYVELVRTTMFKSR